MVAITAKRNYEELKVKLKPKEKITIFTCNTCTRMYETGGLEVMEKLSETLENDGFKIIDRIVLTAACFEDYLSASDISNEFNSGIVLACDSGYGLVKRNFPKKNIIPGLKTLGIQQGKTPKPVDLLEV